MSTARKVSWAVVGLAIVLPINWFRLYFFEPDQTSKLGELIVGSLVCGSIAAALSFFLVKSAKGLQILKAKRALVLQALAARPLAAIRPTQALLQRGEVAYGAATATLHETQTVGYTGRS